MDMSNMKNIVILKNLPSNMVEEAIVVLKENKKIKRYQYVDSDRKKNRDEEKEKIIKHGKKCEKTDNDSYILKEAELIISDYISNLEKKSMGWKNDMKKLKKIYKQSVKLNFILGFTTVIGILLSLM